MKIVIRSGMVLALALSSALAAPRGAEAQLGLLNGVGYGAAGTALGLLVTSGAECSGSGWICIPPEMVLGALGGLTVGAILGARLGSAAENQVARGEPVDNLGALAVGTVLGGAVISVGIGRQVLARDDGSTFIGGPERSATVLALAGGSLAVLYLRARWGELRAIEVTPAVVAGRPGVGARVRF